MNDLNLRIVFTALDLATKDIEPVNAKVRELGQELLKNPFTRAGEDMASFAAAVDHATEPMAQAANQALALGAAITAVAGALAGKVYQSAVEYETALTGLAKVSAGGKAEALAYGAALDGLATRYAANGQALVEAQTNFVQAGFNAADAFNLVEQSLKLMIAGDLSAAQASQDLISILKGFKEPASSAAHAVDMLNEVSNRYATDVKQLATGMAALSPVAKGMGFSMDEAAGLLTPIIEVFQSGNEAADALKTGLIALTSDAKPVVSALHSLGVEQFNNNGQMRTGREIFLDVANGLQTLTAAEKQFTIAQLVGVEQAGRMSVVLGDLGKVMEITGVAAEKVAGGSAMKEVAERLKTAASQAAQAEESFRQLSVTLGNTFKTEIAGVIGATGEMAAGFKRAVDAGDLKPLIAAIQPQIAAVQALFEAMGRNLEGALKGIDWTPLVTGLTEVSGELGQAFQALFAGIDLSTVQGLRAAIQAVVNVLGDMARWIGGVIDGLAPLMAILGPLVQALTSGHGEIAKFVGQMEGLAKSVNTVVPAMSSLGSAVFGAAGKILEAVSAVGLFVGGLKLLNAAGIPAGAMLSGLIGNFFALRPRIAAVLLAMVGLPGAFAALQTAAFGAGYAIGTLIDQAIRLATGGASIGTGLYALTHAVEAQGDALTRAVTADELAAYAKARLTEKIAAQEVALRKVREEQEKNIKEEQAKADAASLQIQITKELTAQWAKQGAAYDAATGKVTKWADLSKVSLAGVDTALTDLGLTTQITTQNAANDAATAYATLARSGTLSAGELAAAWEAASKKISTALALEMTDNSAEVDALAAKVKFLTEQQAKLTREEAAGLPVSAALAEIRKQLVVASVQLTDAAKDAIEKQDRLLAAEQRALAIDTQKRDLQTAELARRRDLAAALGNEVAARTLNLQVLESERSALTAAAEAQDRMAVSLREKARLTQIVAQADGVYTDAEQAQVAALQDAATKAELEADKLTLLAKVKRDQMAVSDELARRERVLGEEFAAVGAQGVKSMLDVRSAIGEVTTGGALEALGSALQAAFDRGALAAADYQAALDEIKKKQDVLRANAKPVTVQADWEQVFKQFGTDTGRYQMSMNKSYGGSGNPAYVPQMVAAYQEWLRVQAGGAPAPTGSAKETLAAAAAQQQTSAPPVAPVAPTRPTLEVKFILPTGQSAVGSFAQSDATFLKNLQSQANAT